MSRQHNEHQEDPTTDPLRIGRFTASALHPAIKKNTKGAYSGIIARTKLIDTKGAENQTGLIEVGGESKFMRDGRIKEPKGKHTWERITGRKIIDSPPVPHETIPHFVASPDGIIADDPTCLVEFKCPSQTAHFRFLRTLNIPEEYQTQMIAQISCLAHLGATQCEFVSYHPKFSPPIKSVRFKPTKAQIKKLEEEVLILGKEMRKAIRKVEANK